MLHLPAKTAGNRYVQLDTTTIISPAVQHIHPKRLKGQNQALQVLRLLGKMTLNELNKDDDFQGSMFLLRKKYLEGRYEVMALCAVIGEIIEWSEIGKI